VATNSHAEVQVSGDAVVRPESGPVEYAPVGNLALWTGVLTGPIVLLLLLETNYVLMQWSCAKGHQWVMHLMDVIAIAVTAFSLVLSWRNWVQSGREWPVDDGGSVERARFLSALGVLMSAGFIMALIAQWIPVMLLGPCQHS